MVGVRIILVTRTGCPACTHFLSGPWPTMKEKLSYGIGGGPVEHIDVARDGIDKVPIPIRKLLKFVPWVYALYDDGTVEPVENPINSPAGLKELEDWATNGPPKYRNMLPEGRDDNEDELVNPRFEAVAVTSSGCHFCAIWESSGGLKRFLDGLSSLPIDKSRYNVTNSPPTGAEDIKRRMALTGVNVPAVVVVSHEKWSHPTSQNLQRTDIMPSPGEVRSPQGLALFRKWIAMLTDTKTPFIGYLVLATNTGCGHCRDWKQSGGMDEFLKTNGNLPGILLVNSERQPGMPLSSAIERPPPAIDSKIQTTPSVFFVPASSWSSTTPEVIAGPDVRDPEAIANWVSELTSEEGQWKNDTSYTPPEYQAAAALRERKSKPSLTSSRRPTLSRQGFR